MKKTIIDYERKIPYIVTIKINRLDDVSDTVLQSGVFCGYIENFNYSNYIFTLLNNKMTVIIPWDWIEFMAPSKKYYDKLKEKKANENLG